MSDRVFRVSDCRDCPFYRSRMLKEHDVIVGDRERHLTTVVYCGNPHLGNKNPTIGFHADTLPCPEWCPFPANPVIQVRDFVATVDEASGDE